MRGRAALVAIVIGVAVAAGVGLSVVFVRSSPASSVPSSPTDRNPLIFVVAAEKQSVGPGEPMPFSAAVRNGGAETIRLTFPTTCRLTFTVRADDSTTVYDSSLHQVCHAVETRIALSPGDAFAVPLVWNQLRDDGLLVPAGREYLIHAVLLTSDPSSRLSADASSLVGVGPLLARAVFRVTMDHEAYAPGDVANVTLILSNNGTTTLHVDSPNACDIGFAVLGPRNVVVYSGRNEVCAMVVTSFTLAPGESRTVVRLWGLTSDSEDLLPPGDYVAWPIFLSAGVSPACDVESVPTTCHMSA